jgi:predicted DNA-binding WGR domain protein
MINYSVLLNADCPQLNIRRSYLIEAGQDLFDNWIVEINYGRIGCQGKKRVILLDDEEGTKKEVIKCLRRRASAIKRIGVGYVVKWVYGEGWINSNIKTKAGEIILVTKSSSII